MVGRPLQLSELREHFGSQTEEQTLTLERIAAQVAAHFKVEARQLPAPGRSHGLLLPRQVSMYLARLLTPLSLQQIGTYFGNRDHSTVLHACRKVAQALQSDAALAGAVRRIHGELG
jgi:chromosomal replication initiator protein